MQTKRKSIQKETNVENVIVTQHQKLMNEISTNKWSNEYIQDHLLPLPEKQVVPYAKKSEKLLKSIFYTRSQEHIPNILIYNDTLLHVKEKLLEKYESMFKKSQQGAIFDPMYSPLVELDYERDDSTFNVRVNGIRQNLTTKKIRDYWKRNDIPVYAFDIECNELEKFLTDCFPSYMKAVTKQDILNCCDSSTGAITHMMSYHGNHKTYTAIHMDKGATEGFNIMVYAPNSYSSPNNLHFGDISNRSNEQGYSVWIFVAPTKIAEFTRFITEFDVLREDTPVTMDILLQARQIGIPIYYYIQRIGDLVCIGPNVMHQVVNIGPSNPNIPSVSSKVAFNILRSEGLQYVQEQRGLYNHGRDRIQYEAYPYRTKIVAMLRVLVNRYLSYKNRLDYDMQPYNMKTMQENVTRMYQITKTSQEQDDEFLKVICKREQDLIKIDIQHDAINDKCVGCGNYIFNFHAICHTCKRKTSHAICSSCYLHHNCNNHTCTFHRFEDDENSIIQLLSHCEIMIQDLRMRHETFETRANQITELKRGKKEYVRIKLYNQILPSQALQQELQEQLGSNSMNLYTRSQCKYL
jgi:hypothetical protein